MSFTKPNASNLYNVAIRHANSGQVPRRAASLNFDGTVLEFISKGRLALYAETCAYSVDYGSGSSAADACAKLG
jgi:hypothetical protein